jgi:hypothetical protein
MKKTNYGNITIWVVAGVFLLVLSFLFGCGLVSILGTESSSEKKVPAEYNLAGLKGKKILILVKQPAWIGAPVALSQMLTEQIGIELKGNVKNKTLEIISYQKLSELRSKETNFGQMSESNIAKKLGADEVLIVMLDSFSLLNLAGANVYKGSLAGKAILIEASDDKQLWPGEGGKIVNVGFDMESGQEKALARLSNSFSHCLTRYLYDCPAEKFKAADDRSGIGWQEWEK